MEEYVKPELVLMSIKEVDVITDSVVFGPGVRPHSSELYGDGGL